MKGNKMLLNSEGRRILSPDGIGIVVFANKTTIRLGGTIRGNVNAGWIITGSWPIDTETETRMTCYGYRVISFINSFGLSTS